MKKCLIGILGVVFGAAAVTAGCREEQTKSNVVDRFVQAAREVYAKDPDCRRSIVARYARNNTVDVPIDNPAWVDDKVPGLVTWVSVEGVRNVRDIGGWTGLKPGMVYRGTELSEVKTEDGNSHGYDITAEGRRKMLEELGVRSDFDLRAVDKTSRGEFVSESPLGKGVMLIDHPLGSYMDIFCYWKPLEYGKALREFVRKEIYPTYIHCAGGADRTGTLCFLLETLCGVSVADATIDYELTSFSPVGLRFRSRESVQPFALVVRTMNTFPGETFADKVAYWAEKVAGVTPAEIAAIRANLMSLRQRD